MRALKIENHDSEEELRKEIRNTKNGRYQLRLRVILSVKIGMSSSEIRKELLISSATYSNWIQKYNANGKEALKQHNSGRAEGNPKWDASIFYELFKKLDLMQEHWSIVKMQQWIKEEYDKDIPYSTIEYRLHKANYSWKTNRPSPYKGDKDKQEEFKKTASRKWEKN